MKFFLSKWALFKDSKININGSSLILGSFLLSFLIFHLLNISEYLILRDEIIYYEPTFFTLPFWSAIKKVLTFNFGHPPLYPIILIFINIFVDVTIKNAHILNLFVCLFTLVMTFKILKRMAGQTYALLGTLLMGVNPLVFTHSALVLPNLLMVALCLLALDYFQRDKFYHFLFFSLLAFYIRESALGFFFVVFLFEEDKKKRFLKYLVTTFLMACFFIYQYLLKGVLVYNQGFLAKPHAKDPIKLLIPDELLLESGGDFLREISMLLTGFSSWWLSTFLFIFCLSYFLYSRARQERANQGLGIFLGSFTTFFLFFAFYRYTYIRDLLSFFPFFVFSVIIVISKVLPKHLGLALLTLSLIGSVSQTFSDQVLVYPINFRSYKTSQKDAETLRRQLFEARLGDKLLGLDKDCLNMGLDKKNYLQALSHYNGEPFFNESPHNECPFLLSFEREVSGRSLLKSIELEVGELFIFM